MNITTYTEDDEIIPEVQLAVLLSRYLVLRS